jgi:hypothetical protein
MRNGFPAVLKTDGSYGGRGLRIVKTPSEARRALQALKAPPSMRRAIKRALINGDQSYLRPCLLRTPAVVNAQGFVAGHDATSAVACWQGSVLASIYVIVLRTMGPYGPSSVVRISDSHEVSAAIAKIVSALRLSGMVGFDFIVEDRTDRAYLIEMNPRATQIGHLMLGEGKDLAAAIFGAISQTSAQRTPSVTSQEVIALFPQEWLRDSTSSFLRAAYHDVPWEEPELVCSSLREPLAARAWSALTSKIQVTRNLARKMSSF